MTSLGIMTLSRSPYSELEKMSLFQDLKLKRRKVDSRCSSDGESLADTNASSPDLVVPLSPKMCDHGSVPSQQQHMHNNNQQAHDKNCNSMSPDALDEDYGSASTTATNSSSSSHVQFTMAASPARNSSGKETPSPMDHEMKTLSHREHTINSVTVTTTKIDDNFKAMTQGGHNAASEKSNSIIAAMNTNSALSDAINSNSSKTIKLTNNTNNHINNVIISNHSASDSRESNNATNESNNNNDNNNNNSETLPNTSVIRLAGDERLSPAKQAFQPHQQQQHQQLKQTSINSAPNNQRIMSPHTVLVTPFRIKTESNTQYNNAAIGTGATATSITSAAITSMSDYRKTIASMQQQHQHNSNAVPTVVTLDTSNNVNNLNNCNNNSNNSLTNAISKATIQRIDAEPNSMGKHSSQIVHTTSAAISQQQARNAQIAAAKNSYSHVQTQNHQQEANKQASPVKNFMFPVNLHAAITNPNPNRIKRERSPIHNMNNQNQSLPMPSQHTQSQQNPSITTVTPVSSGGQMLHPSIQLQHPMRDGAILFRVKNEAQLPCVIQANNQNRIMWNSNTRINGVKPEIIGGSIPGLRSPVSATGHPSVSTSNQGASQTPPRNTPTVIMGESCGVRTMVWGIEAPPNAQQQSGHPQQSQTNSINMQNHNQLPIAGPSSNNEEAAQLLLSLGQSRPNEVRSLQPQPTIRSQHPLNMERLWAGDYSQLPSGQQIQALNLSSQQQYGGPAQPLKNEQEVPPEDDEQPLVCMICEDKATGLHYGIITCEGCKGFFKRTVQNRRVYTCVADGTCEITKAQRNRCQYCRFKKCIEQGMVLQAVREDRMPGGRNSGAVYNLYKVKYKKHKKSAQKPTQTAQAQQQQVAQNQQTHHQQQHSQLHHHLNHQQSQQQQQKLGLICSDTNTLLASQRINNLKAENVVNNVPSHLLNGTILKTALTNPSEIVHLRHRLDNAVSSSKDRSVSYEHAMSMIQTLIEFDAMEDIATLPHFPEFLEDKSEIGDKLCNIGDSIVHKLVSWTKKLPFYLEIPVEIHTKLLTDKWHEILVLTTAAYQALHGKKAAGPQIIQSGQQQNQTITPFLEKDDPEYVQEVNSHLLTLQTCLTTLMGHPISMEQLRLDVGHMVEKMTQITIMFRRIKLRMEEYVCLKVYILLNKEVELEGIQERYVQVLKSYLQHTAPNNPGRLGELLAHIPEIQAAASLLLESKMFYVPFVLNSASVR